jgi:hypothetical protein
MNASLSIPRSAVSIRLPVRSSIFSVLLAFIASLFASDDPAALRYAWGD